MAQSLVRTSRSYSAVLVRARHTFFFCYRSSHIYRGGGCLDGGLPHCKKKVLIRKFAVSVGKTTRLFADFGECRTVQTL